MFKLEAADLERIRALVIAIKNDDRELLLSSIDNEEFDYEAFQKHKRWLLERYGGGFDDPPPDLERVVETYGGSDGTSFGVDVPMWENGRPSDFWVYLDVRTSTQPRRLILRDFLVP
jgi:hypothetical protein